MLAYQFVQIIRRTMQDQGIQGRWSSLRNILTVQQRVTASFRRINGGSLHIRKARALSQRLPPSIKRWLSIRSQEE